MPEYPVWGGMLYLRLFSVFARMDVTFFARTVIIRVRALDKEVFYAKRDNRKDGS